MKTSLFSNEHMRTKSLVLISLMTAITCIIAPFAIPLPFSPVPISLTNLVLYISVYLLGFQFASVSLLLYLLLGFIGLPVFSGFAGGPAKLFGPTGGYLFGFIFLVLISGLFIDRSEEKRWLAPAGMILGTAVCYLFGTLWLSKQLHLTFPQGLTMGVLPYLPGDAVKIIIASILGPVLRKRIKML